jgi:hypothetical protein
MYILTPDKIAQIYKGMGDCVWLIHAVIDGEQMANESQEEKMDCVRRNVNYLEITVAKDFWTDEDMTSMNEAIAAGKAYLGV